MQLKQSSQEQLKSGRGAHMHDASGGGPQQCDAKVEPGGQDNAPLVHNTCWRLPDGHLQQICIVQNNLVIVQNNLVISSSGRSTHTKGGLLSVKPHSLASPTTNKEPIGESWHFSAQ